MKLNHPRSNTELCCWFS